ncbi:MAG: hypothetical protein H6779_04905 [Candidatus Nomurabacteria bacterium]|nr:hypothetical protein [Candidatus Nomurabacteria bacterium]USN87707.1 MAG: hypothetical protein H6779_04905 [Candidatus Nomurabacteria bacterium]
MIESEKLITKVGHPQKWNKANRARIEKYYSIFCAKSLLNTVMDQNEDGICGGPEFELGFDPEAEFGPDYEFDPEFSCESDDERWLEKVLPVIWLCILDGDGLPDEDFDTSYVLQEYDLAKLSYIFTLSKEKKDYYIGFKVAELFVRANHFDKIYELLELCIRSGSSYLYSTAAESILFLWGIEDHFIKVDRTQSLICIMIDNSMNYNLGLDAAALISLIQDGDLKKKLARSFHAKFLFNGEFLDYFKSLGLMKLIKS